MSDESQQTSVSNAWEAVVAIVRQNGLITLALLVLVWTVWFQTKANDVQNAAWRATIGEITKELTTMREMRMQVWREQATMEGRVDEVLRTIQTLLAAVEESCKLK